MNNKIVLAFLLSSAVLVGCNSTPNIRTAIDKTVAISGQSLILGGSYNEDSEELTLTINGDPLIRSQFPPFTPKLTLKTKYKGLDIVSQCYFGSVLSSEGGMFGKIAGAIQASKASSGDKCEMLINNKSVATLYF